MDWWLQVLLVVLLVVIAAGVIWLAFRTKFAFILLKDGGEIPAKDNFQHGLRTGNRAIAHDAFIKMADPDASAIMFVDYINQSGDDPSKYKDLITEIVTKQSADNKLFSYTWAGASPRLFQIALGVAVRTATQGDESGGYKLVLDSLPMLLRNRNLTVNNFNILHGILGDFDPNTVVLGSRTYLSLAKEAGNPQIINSLLRLSAQREGAVAVTGTP